MSSPEFPSAKDPEWKGERIHEQGEILSLIAERIPGLPGVEELKGKITRELRDAEGVYLLELEVPGSMPEQVHEYRYMRQGDHGVHKGADASRIDVILYENGMPTQHDQLAKFNNVTQQWDKV